MRAHAALLILAVSVGLMLTRRLERHWRWWWAVFVTAYAVRAVIWTVGGDAPSWSPEGTLLYFWSDRDGSPCLWAQRLDPVTRRPLGTLLSIQHFHSRGLSWKNLHLGPPGIAVTHGRILFNLGEHTGNVWMTELPAIED